MDVAADLAPVFNWKSANPLAPIGTPLCKQIRGDIWEIRSKVPSGRAIRLLFVIEERELVVLHAFVKKSQKTPTAEIDLAVARLKELRK